MAFPETRSRARGRYGVRRDEIAAAAPDRAPPASAEAEEHVLACCLLDGSDTITRCLKEGLSEESFYFPACRCLWATTLGLYQVAQAAKPPVQVSLEMLIEELKTKRLLEGVGGLPFLMQVTGKIPTTAHAGHFIGIVREKQLLREAVREGQRLVEGIYAYSGGGLGDFEPYVSALQKLEEIKARGASPLPPILRFGEFIGEKKRVLPPELVAGVLHKGAKMMVAGGSKSFKTWVLLDLGLSVATGTPWWGMRTQKGRVLYANFELMVEFCELRTRAIMEAKKIAVAENFDSWHLRGYARDLKDLVPHFLRALAGGQYSLIILDPIYKILGERDENANGDVAQLLNEIEALAVKTGAAVAFGHHHSKGNQGEKDVRDRSSGAGAWTRDPDALIDLTPHEEEEHFVASFTLRNHAAKSPFVVEWVYPCMSVAPGLDPAALRKPGRPTKHEVADILVLLQGRSAQTYGQWEDLAVKNGISESSFKRLLRKARESGRLVEKDERYALKKPDKKT